MSKVRGAVARGALLMVLARFLDRGLGFISMVVLARLLAPDDFGLVAMAMSVVAVLDLLRAFGFDVVIIQHADPSREHYDTAWTFNLIVSLGVSGLLAALAVPAASFYSEPDLVPVLLSLALSPLVSALKNVGIVEFRRELQFDTEFRFLFLARLGRFFVTIPLALLLRNHWALVVGILAGNAFEVALSFVMHPFRPRFSLARAGELFTFSKWLVLKNLVNVMTRRSADFVVGRIVGTRGLGLFNVSQELALLPSSELAAPVNRAIFPGYAKQARDRRALGQGMLEVVGMVALVVLPAGAGLAATAEYAVPLLLGDAWLEAVPLVPILAGYGVVNALGSNTGYLFYALGRPRTVWIVSVLQLVVLLPALVLGVTRYGVEGGAWGYVLASLVAIPVSYALILLDVQRSPLELAARLWRPLAGTGAMVLAVRWIEGMLPAAAGTIELALQAGALVATGGVAYVAVVLALWVVAGRPDGAERYVEEQVRARLGRRARG